MVGSRLNQANALISQCASISCMQGAEECYKFSFVHGHDIVKSLLQHIGGNSFAKIKPNHVIYLGKAVKYTILLDACRK